MRLGADDIAVLCREISALCAGAQVQRVRDGRAGELVVGMRGPGRTHRLLFAAGSWAARLHLVDERPPGPPRPTPFVQLLRKHLVGARFVEARAVGDDRVAEIDFQQRMGDRDQDLGPIGLRVLAELTGRHGNLFLLDDEGRIVGSLRPNVSRRRRLVAGNPYVYPTLPPGARGRCGSALDPGGTGTASRQVAAAFEGEIAVQEREQALNLLRRDLNRARKGQARRLERIQADLERADRAKELQRWGELLQGAYGRVERGADRAHVTDFYDPDLPTVTVPLDPSLSLGQNIRRYFKESKRMSAARPLIESRKSRAETDLAEIDAALRAIGPETTPEALEVLRQDLHRRGLLPRPQPRPAGPTTGSQPAVPYFEFKSANQTPILVGRGAGQNDQLTFRIARGRDLWLHVDGAGGAHVIVRNLEGNAPDAETLVDAATLAAHYSQSRGDTAVDVRYTQRRHVRKPRGAPPGRVLLSHAKTISVRIDPDRLQRLFRTKQ